MRRYSDTARLIPKKLSNYGKNYLRWGEWLIIAPTLRPDFPSYAAIAQHEHSCLFWGGSFCELGILVLSVKFSALWRVIIKSHTLLTRDIASLGRNINKLNQRKPAFAVLSTVMEKSCAQFNIQKYEFHLLCHTILSERSLWIHSVTNND